MRKHIRVQQQLKLHIESVEDRVEELEIEMMKAQKMLDDQDAKISQQAKELGVKEAKAKEA